MCYLPSPFYPLSRPSFYSPACTSSFSVLLPPPRLCRLADKVLLKAQDELLNGDEEQAYILYMRFIDMYKIIYASKEYKRDKGEINKLLPTSKVGHKLVISNPAIW